MFLTMTLKPIISVSCSNEIFLSSATKEILPVTSIKNTLGDGKILNKKVGPIFKNLQYEYDKLISDLGSKKQTPAVGAALNLTN